jgi:ribonuclease P protein component
MMRPPGARPRPGRMRLSRSADFDRVFRHGRSHAGRELVLYVFPRGESDEPRLGLSVSRKVGGAVERNRVKRLLREAFALEAKRLPAATDAVVVARREANTLAEREGLGGIRRALGQLVEKVDPGAESAPTGNAAASGHVAATRSSSPSASAPSAPRDNGGAARSGPTGEEEA